MDDLEFEHKMIKSAGLRFHCVIGGSGPPIVLIAGFPESCYAWRRVMPLLAAHFQVIAIDLPGQGDSDKPMDGSRSRHSRLANLPFPMESDCG
jgi:pimeloyl-ACP methyl ester carboxylesterase